MGTIDETYVNNNNNNNGNESSESEIINRTKYPTMIPSSVQNQNLMSSETAKDESLNRLKYESSRLLTFDKWPASAKVEPRKIAKAGFYYTGQYAEAKCLWCDYVITTWEYGDQVMTRHRSASPDCPFVRDASDNIPLLASSVSSSNMLHSDNEFNTIDRVDYGRQTSNGNSTNSNPDSYNESIGNDEVGDERMSDNTRRLSSPRQGNDRTSPPQRNAGRLNFHPNSGRPLPSDFVNRPTASSPMSPDINDDIYKYESERLKTFDRWPLSYIRPADLANAGFVYTGRGDCVRCVFCQEHVGEWDEDDFPHTEHRSLFPHCPFVRGMDVGNIASNAESRETFERLGLVHSQSQHEGLTRSRADPTRDLAPNRSHDQRYRRNSSNIQSRPDPSSHVRLRPNSGRSSTSYQRQHSDQPQRPRSTSYDHSNPPLYDRNVVEYSGRPQSMLGAGEMMEESYDEAGIRPRYNGPEKGVLNINTTGGANRKDGGMNKKPGSASSSSVAANPEDIGIIRHSGPANPKYSTVEARTRTFREWPPALRQQPAQLSEAGFFYIGLSDQVKCFYCDGGLRNWQPEDDPWTEHARWFSECGFVRLVKGDEFISKCINSHPPVPVQGVPVVSRDRSRNIVSDDELQKMMSSPLVNQVLAMGLDATKVKTALKKRIQETGSGFKFANELVEATLLQAQEAQTGNQGATLLPAAFSVPGQSLPSQPLVPRAESHLQPHDLNPNRLTTEISDRLALNSGNNDDLGISNQNSITMQSAPIQTEATAVSATNTSLEAREPSGLQCQPSLAQPKVSDKNVTESSEDLELENRRLKDQRTCKICMDQEIGVVFLPCGHLISCVQCAPALKDCPLCRQPIHGTVKTYMS